jgi:hypothetical protein
MHRSSPGICQDCALISPTRAPAIHPSETNTRGDENESLSSTLVLYYLAESLEADLQQLSRLHYENLAWTEEWI